MTDVPHNLPPAVSVSSDAADTAELDFTPAGDSGRSTLLRDTSRIRAVHPASTIAGSAIRIDLDQVRIDAALALRVPPGLAIRRQVLPLCRIGERVHVACANPSDTTALSAVERHMNSPVVPVPAHPDSLRRAFIRVFGSSPRDGEPAPARPTQPDDAPLDATSASDELLIAAVLRGASDLHLDPDRESLVARLRVDGVLEHYRRLPIALHPEVVSRFKVQAGMDIAERRAPQDGRFTWQPAHGPAAGQRVDVRVASMPTVHGERLTLRLLALQGDALTLERLGMRAEHLDLFSRCLRLPWGLALITGPTGSGKTTTLYAGLRQLIGERHLNVITVEDPIESDVPGIAQVEVDSADKVSFGKALRSVLRHDPDVVMVGEVRDRETADIVIKSALTGHLVLSTLHTNSATGAVTRLVDMGVEPYLVAATLRLAVAQRLARKLCSRCASARPLTLEEATGLGSPPHAGASAHDAHGCVYCAGRGYIGRVGLFEMLPVTADWSREIAEGASEGAIREQAMARGMSVLADDAIRKVCDGTISPRDALAAVAGW